MAIALSALQNIEVFTLDSNKITDASMNAYSILQTTRKPFIKALMTLCDFIYYSVTACCDEITFLIETVTVG